MKPSRALCLLGFALIPILILAACAPAPTPAPTSAPPTQAPSTPPPSPVSAATSAPTASTAATARPKTQLSIVTGTTGGVYYPYGGGLAGLIGKNITNVQASAEATAASVDNLKLIQNGKADIAFTLADTLFDAYKGQGPFKDSGAVPVRALAVLYSNYTHIVASDDSGIKTVADLKGKRVSVGAPGSGTEIIANRILEAVGIDPEKDFQRQRLSPADSAGAMKDKKLDAFFWSGGVPTPAILDLAATPGTKLRYLANDDLIQKLVDKYGPFYFKLTMAKSAYPGMEADVNVIGVANLLVVNENFDASLAYDILKMMVDKQSDLGLITPDAKSFGLPQASVGSPVPFHAGAIKFYAEKGITIK
jgi:uncharacterized protein